MGQRPNRCLVAFELARYCATELETEVVAGGDVASGGGLVCTGWPDPCERRPPTLRRGELVESVVLAPRQQAGDRIVGRATPVSP